MKIRPFWQGILLFFMSAAWFALFLPWNGFIDPDAFYHAKAALLFWQHGPLMSFPWLDLTTLGGHFADLHFLFHAISAPFVAALGMMNGIRVVTLLTSAIFILTFWACLRWLDVRWPLFWTATLLVSTGLDVRLLLGKASALALTWFIFGLAATWKRRPWLVALATAGFALSHGGWPYLAGSVVLIAIADVVFQNVVTDVPIRTAIARAPWREVLASFFGAALGLAIHPNRMTIISMAWTQIVTIGLGTPFQHVNMGVEWLPSDLGGMFLACAPLAMFTLLSVAGLLFARRKDVDVTQMRITITSGLVFAVLFALTIKSRRNIEYLIPIFTLWVSVLWMQIDEHEFRRLPKLFVGRMQLFAPIVVAACLVVTAGKEVYSMWNSFHPVGHPDQEYAQTVAAIAERAQPGDRVFHTSWDEFPMLFAQDDRLKYVSGLDPTFLYVATSTLSDAYTNATLLKPPTTSDTIFHLAYDQMHARFLFVSKKNHLNFLAVVLKDTRFHQIADHNDSAAFELIP